MKVLIIDGQGGKIGASIVEQLVARAPELEIIAVGTNTMATAAMMKAGAKWVATGENPVVYNSALVDIIIGPIGILSANALLGEITAPMAQAIASSQAQKILIPLNKCSILVVGTENLPITSYISAAVELVLSFAKL